MAMRVEDNKLLEVAEVIMEKGLSGMPKVMEIILNEAMRIERERHLNASMYERTDERTGYANGYKPKTLKTSVGALTLSVPQTRDGEFYPSFLEKGIRSERALKIAMAEMYIKGVSTRKVSSILEELCGFQVTSDEVSRASKLLDEEFSTWRNRPIGKIMYLYLDARYEKIRVAGSVIDHAVLIAYGVDEKGTRKVLGVSISLSEAETHWRNFLESLVERGLHGLTLTTSDAHSGLKAALKSVFPSVPWQRCQFHLQQNAQSYVPLQSLKKEVASDIRAIFDAPNRNEADRLLKMTLKKYEDKSSQLSEWLEVNIPEGLTVFSFNQTHQKKIRTTNMPERVNREIKRRTNVVSIFPSEESCLRLVTGVLVEISEGWETGGKYLSTE